MFDCTRIVDLITAYLKQTKKLGYGTAGFRDKHSLPLHSVFVRMGILASLRSMSVGSKSIGVMITASHNPEDDNGIKIVDFDGGMLSQSWEPYAEALANAENDDFLNIVEDIIRQEAIDTSMVPVVIIGRDTRWHSTELSNCVDQGVVSVGGLCHNLGEVATPQLHFVVHQLNTTRTAPLEHFNAIESLYDYYSDMTEGFVALKATAERGNHTVHEVVIDASNGVPSMELTDFKVALNGLLTISDGVCLDVRNANGTGKVNEGCGAELVQKNQVPPLNVSAEHDAGKLMCSFDGDGDRIVFHYFDGVTRKWVLLDGDKIATLVTTFLFNELVAAGLDKQFKLGIVQTAYANGASTHYLHSKGVEVAIAKTGVKFVHHKALEFDIGVYFEANGHGTVLFSEAITTVINDFQPGSADEARKALAFTRLQASLRLINQSVGDALSDMLLCLASLQVLNMTMYDWNALYTDYPSSQMKVKVPDKSRVTCSEDETTVLTPAALQVDLNQAMASVTKGRCFVRPSGTEDVVRIYAEAATVEEASILARLTKEAIEKHLF